MIIDWMEWGNGFFQAIFMRFKLNGVMILFYIDLMIKMNKIILFVFLCVGCNSIHENWKGGAIHNLGIYRTNDLEINVKETNGQVQYYMKTSKGDTLIKHYRSFSDFHRWALHLDKKLNLWVFSSDIGSSLWKKDSIMNRYTEHTFFGPIPEKSIPDDVWITACQFYPYNKK
ncbi:MAG: hypothetical protein OEW75_00745 [Cyclobacteriaceae bacterium]|nr:hypothetical protein [Cyclobacteriaceae bacterium]